MSKHRIYAMSSSSVYPLYVAKAEKKGRTKAEVDDVIRWLRGYSQKKLEAQLRKQTDIETFLVEDIKEPTMQGIRYLDKLIDELAKGRAMEKILRKE